MSINKVMVDGQEYPIASLEPESWDYPSPAYPVAITPLVARSWLRWNFRNRTQRETGKRDYSGDMKDANFAINGATVTFTRPHLDGEDDQVPEGAVALLDGQHRLESCVASGKPFVTYVAYGLSPRVRHTVDTGIKRTYGDVLHLRGVTNSNVLASVIKKSLYWETGNQHLIAKNRSTTHSQMDEFFEKHPEVQRSAYVASQTHTDFMHSTGHPLRQSVTGLAHWLFMQCDPRKAPEFFARVGDGAEMSKDDPIMLLRRRFVKDLTVAKQNRGETRRTIQNVPDWQYLCYYIRTWNARRLWEELPESEKDLFSFAALGPTDSQRIPVIKSPEEVAKELLKREEGKSEES